MDVVLLVYLFLGCEKLITFHSKRKIFKNIDRRESQYLVLMMKTVLHIGLLPKQKNS